MDIFLVIGILAIAGIALTATVRAVRSDGYGRVRTDLFRIPDRETPAAATGDAMRATGDDYAGSGSPR